MARELDLLGAGTAGSRTDGENTILGDHALYDWPAEGPSTVQQRLRSLPLPGSAEVEEVRRAMAAAAFTLLRVEDTRPGEGLVVRDLVADRRLPVADRGMSRAGVGTCLAGRLLPFARYAMLSGAAFPLPKNLCEGMADAYLQNQRDLPDASEAETRRGFSVAIHRYAFEHGHTAGIRYEMPT